MSVGLGNRLRSITSKAKPSRAAVLLALTGFSLQGCASAPSVEYQAAMAGDSAVAKKEAADQGRVFTLPISRILVAPSAPAKSTVTVGTSPGGGAQQGAAQGGESGTGGGAADPASPGYTATVVPVESTHSYVLKPHSGFWSSTAIDITKVPNTDIAQSVGSTFTDQTQTRITQIGGLITAAAGLAVLGAEAEPSCDAKRQTLGSFVVRVTGQNLTAAAVPGAPCYTYTVRYDSDAPMVGAVKITDFEADFGKQENYFPVPACRDVLVNIAEKIDPTASPPPRTFQLSVRVVDPDYVLLVPLPSKGKVTLHPVCNADTSDSAINDPVGQYLQNLTALMTQAQNIEKAAKPAKKGAGG